MSDKSKVNPLRLKVEETQRFFEVIGEIIFQFSIIDYQLSGMLSIIMNYKSDETGDFILNYLGATTGRKQQLLLKIVDLESVKLTISNGLFKEIKKVAENLNPIITKRNKIVHGLGSIETDEDGWPKTLNLIKYQKKELGYSTDEVFNRKDLIDFKNEIIQFRFSFTRIYDRYISEFSYFNKYGKVIEE